ncbi:MAG: multicopper oxidase domain-containing protein [Bacteroidia bacterium]
MKKHILAITLAIGFSISSIAQNQLFIPDTLSGSVINLTVQAGTTQFIGANNTNTYGYNGNILGPTLIIHKDDSVTLNVTNNINQPTTVHWHGFHISPHDDGGPHQLINLGVTWSPRIKMRNEASTFWYHPHGEAKTEMHVSKGLAGMIIVRDNVERNYTLPRTYGVDDFPIIVQSKVFDAFYNIAISTHEDSINMVNATIDPYLQVPKQVVRLRLLNGASDRTYNFGLSDNSNFYLIGSDGGLLSAPHMTNRLRLSTGERAEILVDLSSYTVGQQIYLKSYASELPNGIIGADSVGTAALVMSEGYYDNPLNGADFNVLRLDIAPQTTNAVTTIPSNFTPKVPLTETNIDAYRHIHLSGDTVTSGAMGNVDGPFLMNNTPFHMDSINVKTFLNNKEVWKLTNSSMVAHPFHIHDIQFYVLDINGMPPPPEYRGLKDVILVKPLDTIRFITIFETFADNTVPYMYHCHLLHHEDDGMMHTFLVQTPDVGINEYRNHNLSANIYPNPTSDKLKIEFDQNDSEFFNFKITNSLGQIILEKNSIFNNTNSTEIDLSNYFDGIYFIHLNSNKGSLSRKIIKR